MNTTPLNDEWVIKKGHQERITFNSQNQINTTHSNLWVQMKAQMPVFKKKRKENESAQNLITMM